ncbi:MAG: carbohydrate-binding family 9-like protein [Candidatus Zophobacter franzmannii]|nr:carbohydrate-binding family 9-like protein [Candidatus Zophobacter franzmannii]
MKKLLIVFIMIIALSCIFAEEAWTDYIPLPELGYGPLKYQCQKTDVALNIDGKIDEKAWDKVEWTEKFVDIEGSLKPEPTYKTNVKMLWDDKYFYFACAMVEPHIWAKLKERDSVIFFDNDFEIFIDPDSDTKNYYEFEMNAFNTVWDLLLISAYRDPGPNAIDSWDIQGLKSAVHIDGTLNDPSDIDNGWSVEVAIPWKVLEECAQGAPPKPGDVWRVNFSRVEWDTDIVDGDYIKRKAPEHNWVWSAQGLINMHYPELWGFVEFHDGPKTVLKKDYYILERIKWQLRRLYYKQYTYRLKNKQYTDIPVEMGLIVSREFPPPRIHITPNWYEATITWEEYIISIQADGKVWVKEK